MKKKTKSTKSKKSLKSQLSQYSKVIKTIAAGHGVFIMFLIAGSAIGFALFRSQGYLNPERNETKYQELSSGVSYSKIDYKLVTKLQEALKDTDVTVSQNLAPNRNNPFNE